MKRLGNIYNKLCSVENINLAFDNASKGKKHYREVKAIEANRQKYVDSLREMLASGSFKNSPYTTFKRVSGGKERVIKKLPYYPDRIVHHCIVQVVQDVWINNLIRDTYSTVPARGIHDGVRRVKKALADTQATTYCLKLDIQKYYPSIDNKVLKTIIRQKIKDNQLLALLDEIIDSEKGVPIGNYVSQWFGNLYLSGLDHWIKETLRCKYYFRYCDDLVLLANCKETLWQWLFKITMYLEEKLKLIVKPTFQVFPVMSRGIDFLGYRFFHGYTLVRKRIVTAMKQKTHQPKSMASYYGWLKHADAYRLTQKYINT